MHPICGFLAIAQATQGAPAQEIPVQYMRPSKLVELLNQAQPSTVLSADDEKGVFYVRGDKETVDQYKAIANLFDVKPRRVKVRIEADSQIDRMHSSSETVVANNRPFVFSDQGMDLDVKVASRINDDNTITVFVAPTYAKKSTSVALRVKQNDEFSICLNPDGRLAFVTDGSDGKKWYVTADSVPGMERRAEEFKTWKWPVLRLKAAIAE